MGRFLPHSLCRPSKPDFSRFLGLFGVCSSPFGDQQADFALCRRQSPAEQRRHPGQVVTSEGEDGLGLHFRQANKTGFAQTADGLAPPKNLFHQLALLQADRIAHMSGRAAIDRRAGLLRCHMRRHLHLTQRLHEVGGVVTLVRTQRVARLERPGRHLQGRFSFRLASGLCRFNINHQAVTVLHQGVPHVAQARFVARALLEEPRLIIGRRSVRLIAALLPFEVHRRILAATFGRLARTILGHKALHRGPGFNQRPVDRKMFMRGQSLPLSQGNYLAEELTHDVFGKEPIPVLRKGGGCPDAFIHRQADKPAVQQVVFNMLDQLPFRANGEQHLKQTRTQQSLRRNTRTSRVRVQLGKRAVHRAENAIDQHAQFAQRMPLRNPLLKTPVAEHRMLCRIRRSHLLQSRPDKAAIISLASDGRGF